MCQAAGGRAGQGRPADWGRRARQAAAASRQMNASRYGGGSGCARAYAPAGCLLLLQAGQLLQHGPRLGLGVVPGVAAGGAGVRVPQLALVLRKGRKNAHTPVADRLVGPPARLEHLALTPGPAPPAGAAVHTQRRRSGPSLAPCHAVPAFWEGGVGGKREKGRGTLLTAMRLSSWRLSSRRRLDALVCGNQKRVRKPAGCGWGWGRGGHMHGGGLGAHAHACAHPDAYMQTQPGLGSAALARSAPGRPQAGQVPCFLSHPDSSAPGRPHAGRSRAAPRTSAAPSGRAGAVLSFSPG